MADIPETKGHKKLKRFIQDLIRNKHFLNDLKLLKRYQGKMESRPVLYADMTLEQQKEHDHINNEIRSIIGGYELLRKRTKRLFDSKAFRKQVNMAEKYGLDTKLQGYAQIMLENYKRNVRQESAGI